MIRGIVGLLAGGLVGAFIGGVLTLCNNLFLVPATGAAHGSYSYWVGFFGIPGAVLGLGIGVVIAARRGVRPAPPGRVS